MMRKKTTFGFAITCVLIAAVIAFVAGFAIAGNKVKNVTTTEGSTGYALLDEVEKVVSENYLGEADKANVEKGLCKGYVEGVSNGEIKYLSADEYAAYSKGTTGETIIYKNFGKGVGYMQFLGFNDSTKQSFSDALSDFSKSATSKVNMLVLDLRNCSSDDVESAAGVLDLLLPEGELIAGIDKNGTRSVLYTSDSSELDYDIAVLVNGKTSGAAEIFAATLNAYDKAIIVGTTTAGDCTKSDAHQLSNGDYILIPNMYYVTKGQQTYSNSGVVPTQIVELSASEQSAYDSSTLDISKDPQFAAAVKALGVNDMVTVTSSSDTDTDTDKNSFDSDTDSEVATIDTDGVSSGDTSSGETSSEEVLDPYWDDDEYWESSKSDSSVVDDGYYEDDYYYDDGEYYDDYGYDYGYNYEE